MRSSFPPVVVIVRYTILVVQFAVVTAFPIVTTLNPPVEMIDGTQTSSRMALT